MTFVLQNFLSNTYLVQTELIFLSLSVVVVTLNSNKDLL